MALDFFAIASNGGFSTPTPNNDERMSLIATWGYFDGAPEVRKTFRRGLNRFGMSMRLD